MTESLPAEPEIKPQRKRALKLTLAYDGTDFHGWQIQTDLRSVQEEMQIAVQRVTGEKTVVTGAGRTDAGVHAEGQVAGLETDCELPPNIFLRAINSYLPIDISVRRVEEAKLGFDPIREASGKRYRYLIHSSRRRDVFSNRYAWFVPHVLDAEAMHRAGEGLLGKHDFCSYQSAGSPRVSTVRTVTDLTVRRGFNGDESKIAIEIAADGFLYTMVRTIVGTLYTVGRGRADDSHAARVLASQDRKQAGQTAPAHGLCLLNVDYNG